MINTDKGKLLFEKAKGMLECVESNSQDCLQEQLQRPAFRPKEKDKFQDDYIEKGFEYVLHRYAIVGISYQIKRGADAVKLLSQKVEWHIKRIFKR